MEFEIAIKIVIIPMIPNSAGVSSLARTSPTRKVIPDPAMLSMKLQLTPFSVLLFNDPDTNYYLPIFIHGVVIVLVLSARYVIQPLLVIEVPFHRLLYALLELQ